MKLGECFACYREEMVFIKTVTECDGQYRRYKCDNCGYVAQKKLKEATAIGQRMWNAFTQKVKPLPANGKSK